MLDLYMVLLLAATFSAFYGLMYWCERTIKDPTGEDNP